MAFIFMFIYEAEGACTCVTLGCETSRLSEHGQPTEVVLYSQLSVWRLLLIIIIFLSDC